VIGFKGGLPVRRGDTGGALGAHGTAP